MAITLPKMIPLGGGVTEFHGTFVHTLGAAEETFKIGSHRVQSISIENMDSGAKLENVRFSESVSGATNTVTVHCLNTVADGRIVVKAMA